MIPLIAVEEAGVLTEGVLKKESIEVSKKTFQEASSLKPSELLSKSEEIGISFDNSSMESMIKETASNNYNDVYNSVLKGESTFEDLTTAYTEKIEAFKEDYILNRFAGLEYNGVKFSEYGFPEFDSSFEANIPLEDYNASRARHFNEANKQLSEALQNNPELVKQFSDRQISQINLGSNPDGYTWHHDGNPPPGKLQLVYTAQHDSVKHHGGFSQIKTV